MCLVESNLSRTLQAYTLDLIVKSDTHESETLLSSKLVITPRIHAMKSLKPSRKKTGHQKQLPRSFLPMSDKHLQPEQIRLVGLFLQHWVYKFWKIFILYHRQSYSLCDIPYRLSYLKDLELYLSELQDPQPGHYTESISEVRSLPPSIYP